MCSDRAALAVAALAVVAVSAVPAHAATITFTTTLAPEAVGATGSGTATVVFDDAAHTLTIDTTFTGLSGTTTVAHIHCCVNPPGTAGVALSRHLPGVPDGVDGRILRVALSHRPGPDLELHGNVSQ